MVKMIECKSSSPCQIDGTTDDERKSRCRLEESAWCAEAPRSVVTVDKRWTMP